MTPVIRTERLVARCAAETDVPALIRFFDENREHMAPWEPPRPPDFHTDAFWRVQVGRHRRAFESGAAAALIGAVPAVVLGGAASIAVALIWAWRFPELRRIDRFDELRPAAARLAPEP